MQKSNHAPEQFHINNEKGQTFVEFLFLLVILVGLSLGLLKGSNSFLAKRWEIAVGSIVRNYPGQSTNVKLTE